MIVHILQRSGLAVTALLFLQWHNSVRATDPVTLLTFSKRLDSLMEWMNLAQIKRKLYRLHDANPDIWMYHQQFWQDGSVVLHLPLGPSENGASQLILSPIQPDSPLGRQYWNDNDLRFLAAELKQGQYPVLHGYLKFGEDQDAGTFLRKAAMGNPNTLPVLVSQDIPARYRRPPILSEMEGETAESVEG